MLIEALKKYNKYIGGTKGDLKYTGLIKFMHDAPEMSAIKAGEKELYHQVAGYHKKRGDFRFEDEMSERVEDEEMADAETATKKDGNGPVTFELAMVGGKKDVKDGDEDQEMA